MEIEKCKKRNKELREVGITIRTTKATSKFLADNDLSPTAIFDNAVKELRKQVKTE